MTILSKDEKAQQRKESRKEINKLIVAMRADLDWAEKAVLLPAWERQGRITKAVRKLEREVLNYGRLL